MYEVSEQATIYVVICAITIYVILDLELPRIGLITLKAFDRTLVESREEMI